MLITGRPWIENRNAPGAAMATVAGWLVLVCLAGQSRGDELTISPVFLKVVQEAEVPALQEGSIRQVLVKEGDSVSVGQPLVQIDDQLAKVRKAKAEVEYAVATKNLSDTADLVLAEAEIKVATANLQRAMESRKRFPDTPSQAEVDDLELRLAQASLHRQKANHALQLAELAVDLSKQNLAGAALDVERYLTTSPIQGTIVELTARQGEWIKPGEVVARVVRLDRLRAEGRMPHQPSRKSLLGSAVTFAIEGAPQAKHSGKIVFVSPEVDPNDRSQRVVAEIENSQGSLNPGLRGQLIVRW